MKVNNYQELAMRTNDQKSTDRLAERIGQTSGYNFDMVGALLNGALGLTGEAGEVADIIKKYAFHGHNIRLPELIKELGDVCWYIALISSALGVDLEVILRENVKKLENRYPEGFSSEASINRSI